MKRVPQPNVLFVNIGWAQEYDGRHVIQGSHEDIRNKGGDPTKLSEGQAFLPDDNRIVHCGAGNGKVVPSSSIDLVFVAKNPGSRSHEIVGIYFEPDFYYHPWTNPKGNTITWAEASTKQFTKLLGNQRPNIAWPAGRSMRRWVSMSGTIYNQKLFNEYVALI
jgi:hypothetical protein